MADIKKLSSKLDEDTKRYNFYKSFFSKLGDLENSNQ